MVYEADQSTKKLVISQIDELINRLEEEKARIVAPDAYYSWDIFSFYKKMGNLIVQNFSNFKSHIRLKITESTGSKIVNLKKLIKAMVFFLNLGVLMVISGMYDRDFLVELKTSDYDKRTIFLALYGTFLNLVWCWFLVDQLISFWRIF